MLGHSWLLYDMKMSYKISLGSFMAAPHSATMFAAFSAEPRSSLPERSIFPEFYAERRGELFNLDFVYSKVFSQ